MVCIFRTQAGCVSSGWNTLPHVAHALAHVAHACGRHARGDMRSKRDEELAAR